MAGTHARALGFTAAPSSPALGLARLSEMTPPSSEESSPPAATITALLPVREGGAIRV